MTDRKRLILFRHAKSDWGAPRAPDHERPLNARGRKTAAVMGRLLARSGQTPERILCSTAVRARSTLEIASESGSWDAEREFRDDLYDTSPARTLEVLRKTPDDVRTLLVVGHQPTWSELASQLVGGGALRFATAAMARIDLSVDAWADLAPGCGELAWLLQPKFFTKGDFGELL